MRAINNIMHDDQAGGLAVRGLRERQGLSQAELADLLGVSQPAISNAERGRMPSVAERAYDVLVRLEAKRLSEGTWKPLAWQGSVRARRGVTRYSRLEDYQKHLTGWRVLGATGASHVFDICFLRNVDGVTQGFGIFNAAEDRFAVVIPIDDAEARNVILAFDDFFTGRLAQVAIEHDGA